ncbi:DUF2066 domain-containing protein [Novispirillum itersonii]|uniref:DUF3313 domain-containing protein n=1 Tax=Novispirillum itersonii TaxID=189 RepID=A0A7W9ZDZ3_NOVIT|nr:DUF2066 domain-containing protein [Novispirillum itersonii]MBB6208872.1 hypothetical protein [Novispirillum itersonii]
MSALSRLRPLLPACLMACVLATPATAAPPSSAFYTGEAIITGRDIPAERLRGYRMALPRVVAKVSGDSRLGDSPAVQAALDHADALVRDVSFIDRLAKKKLMDEQGTRERSFLMTVQFDPAAVDRLIRASGRQPWPEPRPTVRVALRITDSVGPFLLAEDSPRGTGQREVVTDVARRLGLPVVLSGDQAPPPPAAAILTGDMVIRPEGGWTTAWTLTAAVLPQPVRWESQPGTFDRAIADGLEETSRTLSPSGRR